MQSTGLGAIAPLQFSSFNRPRQGRKSGLSWGTRWRRGQKTLRRHKRLSLRTPCSFLCLHLICCHGTPGGPVSHHFAPCHRHAQPTPCPQHRGRREGLARRCSTWSQSPYSRLANYTTRVAGCIVAHWHLSTRIPLRERSGGSHSRSCAGLQGYVGPARSGARNRQQIAHSRRGNAGTHRWDPPDNDSTAATAYTTIFTIAAHSVPSPASLRHNSVVTILSVHGLTPVITAPQCVGPGSRRRAAASLCVMGEHRTRAQHSKE